MTKNPTFDPPLCEIHCLTILSLRDLRPITIQEIWRCCERDGFRESSDGLMQVHFPITIYSLSLRLERPVTGSVWPSESRKSLKRAFPGLLARSAKKSRKRQKSLEKLSKRDFLRLFLSFLGLFGSRPGKIFLRLFQDFGHRGPDIPGGDLKKSQSPGQEKNRKSASESAGPKRGAEESAKKSVLCPVSYTTSAQARSPGALFLAHSSAPRFGPALFEAHFRHLSWLGASALL